jgi:hypothetical protein
LDTTEEVQFVEEAPLTEEVTTAEAIAEPVVEEAPVVIIEPQGHPSRDFRSGK